MFTWDTVVRYSQVGPEGVLSPIAVLDLFQDIATMHARQFGLGPLELTARERAWVLSRWRVRLEKLPGCGQAVRVGTRAYDCRRALCRRAFSLTDAHGHPLAAGDSLWTLIDLRTGRPADAREAVAPYLEVGPADAPTGLPHKVQPPRTPVALESVTATRDLLDANRHVNNVRSAALAMGRLPEGAAFSGIAVDYHQPILAGQRVEPLLAEEDTGWSVALTVGGVLCVSTEFVR